VRVTEQRRLLAHRQGDWPDIWPVSTSRCEANAAARFTALARALSRLWAQHVGHGVDLGVVLGLGHSGQDFGRRYDRSGAPGSTGLMSGPVDRAR
jgi:hypothetical protein